MQCLKCYLGTPPLTWFLGKIVVPTLLYTAFKQTWKCQTHWYHIQLKWESLNETHGPNSTCISSDDSSIFIDNSKSRWSFYISCYLTRNSESLDYYILVNTVRNTGSKRRWYLILCICFTTQTQDTSENYSPYYCSY